MNHEKIYNYQEFIQKISLNSPAVESFLDPAYAAEVWPEDIATNKIFLEQIEMRKELNEHLDDILKCLPRPDLSLQAAVGLGHITEQQVAMLYESFNKLLEGGPDYSRFILYCPFEFLPNTTWNPATEELKQSSDKFRGTYMESWQSLLSVYDVRANFVDGDILEEEHRHGDLPRVVKAAHLIPKLVENGLTEFKEVITLMEETDDNILKDSLADTLPVLADLGFITEKEIRLMEKSKDRLVTSMARIINSNIKTNLKQAEAWSKEIVFLSVQEELNEEFSQIDGQDYDKITNKRKVWLKQKKKQEAIEAQGRNIGLAMVENKLSDKAEKDFLSVDANTRSQQALAEGIRLAIESTVSTDLEKAQALYAQHKETLLKLWKNDDVEIRETLAKTFRRLFQLGIVDDEQLAELNIVIPKLAGPFSENLKLMQEEMNDIRSMVASIESSPELARFIYPTALVYGSRLKGYGDKSADIDLGVFVRPGTPFSDRTKMQELLKKTFTPEKIKGEIIEFWLEENQDRLKVSDFGEANTSLGGSSWTHILFGAAWEGDKEVIRELREKLLVAYLYDTDKKIYERNARELNLEEMERDTLQYRLMHKGYEKFFPPYGGIHTLHADEIDGESMFWDSGYRQLATKLFVSRVFLPKIFTPEK